MQVAMHGLFSLLPPFLFLYLSVLVPVSFSQTDQTFNTDNRPEDCGIGNYSVSCIADRLTIRIDETEHSPVKVIDYEGRVLAVANMTILNDTCSWHFGNTTTDNNLFNVTQEGVNFRLPKCPSRGTVEVDCNIPSGTKWYYGPGEGEGEHSCNPLVVVPLNKKAAEKLQDEWNGEVFEEAYQEGFNVTWKAGGDWCPKYLESGVVCELCPDNQLEKTCFCSDETRTAGSCPTKGKSKKTKESNKTKEIVICVSALHFVCLVAAIVFCWWKKYGKGKNRRSSSRSSLIQSISSGPSALSKETEYQSNHHLTHIFSYKELEDATEGFNSSKEIGNGGFGAVYKGELRDGRIVAVKRLYGDNHKRMEQFMNEIRILNQLRHPNLVTLYGCTSRQSRELLLVYEYVANGTVADHLHGPRADERGLTWPIRMNIALETAAALVYLHATEPQIIHRDVTTCNILLDEGFHVKVGDFGLSRLFPLDVTHVCTAPQGTPGYVDPEYHQCYQLTDKSDVYSFGVVLVELISSKPAVDMNRSRNEINLSNMAINKIRDDLVHELADPQLGFESDPDVTRMIRSVAELSFLCLQAEKDMRPSIEEVKNELVTIASWGRRDEVYVDVDKQKKGDAYLLSHSVPFSPDTVTMPWSSRTTTPNTSA